MEFVLFTLTLLGTAMGLAFWALAVYHLVRLRNHPSG